MKTRPLEDSDVPILRAMYDRAEIQDGWPDLAKAAYVRVLVGDDGEILGFGGARMVPEVFVMLKEAHPAARLGWLRILQCELRSWMNETGYRRVIALVAPKIERGFLRRLRSLGWKEGCQSAILLTGDKDEGFRRKGR